MSERPAPPEGEYEDLMHVAEPDLRWRLATGKRCRRKIGRRDFCRRPSVAEFYRGRGPVPQQQLSGNWWAYCEEHLQDYGNWLEGGQVMHYILREIGVQP